MNRAFVEPGIPGHRPRPVPRTALFAPLPTNISKGHQSGPHRAGKLASLSQYYLYAFFFVSGRKSRESI